MTRAAIAPDELSVRAHNLWGNQWLLLTAGDFDEGRYNTMTVGWGSFGTMWGMPFAQVVVRPSRYTRVFMEQYNTFTLCAFPDTCRKALQLLGSKSGRDGDKIAETGLTPIASSAVAAPGFEEAELTIECRKIYWQDMDAEHFLEPTINRNYPQHDYHRTYYGEIVAAAGTDSYR
jgi:flavin reductase (DIM6/NTAB) family NADH-FMN oxidoreductase RutF